VEERSSSSIVKASAELSPEEAEEVQDREISQSVKKTKNNVKPKNARNTKISYYNNW
jgi:hypothetical protein